MSQRPTFLLREVTGNDLAAFFDQQLDPEANFMAAFTSKDPTNRAGFLALWARIRADATVIARTIVVDGQVAGHVMSYEDGRCELTYWLGKEYWGQGIATRALGEFLAETNRSRPIYARAARACYALLAGTKWPHGLESWGWQRHPKITRLTTRAIAATRSGSFVPPI